MGKEYFDRYQSFKFDGGYKPLPFITIPPKDSDKTVGENLDTNKSPQGGKKVPETMIMLKSGDINLTLPRNSTNIEIVKSVLDEMKKK